MAGLPWVKVATDFADHPKALALSTRLADARAPLHLPPVWGHFARHYADGSMPATEDAIRALERAALWGGAPGALVAALVDVGLLERRRNRLRVHGWAEWQEGHARKLERDRQRMRSKRAEGREPVTDAVDAARPRGSEEHQAPGSTQGESRDRRAIEERERRGEEDPSATPRAAAPPKLAAEDDLPPKQLEVLDLTVGLPTLPDPGPSPQQRVVEYWCGAWERAGRGKHSPLTEAEGATIKRLVRQLGADEFIARIDRALADPWFLEHGDLLLFAKQREKFAPPGRPAPRARERPAGPPAGAVERASAASDAKGRRVRGAIEKELNAEIWAREFADVPISVQAGRLTATARDSFHGNRLRDPEKWGEFLVRIAQGELGEKLELVVVEARGAAAQAQAAAGA